MMFIQSVLRQIQRLWPIESKCAGNWLETKWHRVPRDGCVFGNTFDY